MLKLLLYRKYEIIAIILCVFIQQIFIYNFYTNIPQDSDVGCFMAIGQGLNHGKILYKEIWDNKAPGIFFIHSFFQIISSRSPNYPIFIQIIFSSIYSFIFIFTLWNTYRHAAFSSSAILFCTSSYFFQTQWAFFYTGGFTEEIGTYILISSFCLFYTSNVRTFISNICTKILLILSGLFFGLAILIKEPFIFCYFAFIGLSIISPSNSKVKFRKLLLFSLWSTIPALLFLSYLIINEALFDYINYLNFAIHYATKSTDLFSEFLAKIKNLLLQEQNYNLKVVFSFFVFLFYFLFHTFKKNHPRPILFQSAFLLFVTTIPMFMLGAIPYGHYYIPFILCFQNLLVITLNQFVIYLSKKKYSIINIGILISLLQSSYFVIKSEKKFSGNSVTVDRELKDLNFPYLNNSNCYIDDQTAGRINFYFNCSSKIKFTCPYYVYFLEEHSSQIGDSLIQNNKLVFSNQFLSSPPEFILAKRQLSIAFDNENLKSYIYKNYNTIDSFYIGDNQYFIKKHTKKPIL